MSLPFEERVDEETLAKMNLEAKMFDKEYPDAPHWVRFQGYFNICVKYMGVEKAKRFAAPKEEAKSDEQVFLYGLECQDCKLEFTEVATRSEIESKLKCPVCGSTNIDDCEEIKEDIKNGRLN